MVKLHKASSKGVPLLHRKELSRRQKWQALGKLTIRRYSDANISDNAKVIAYYALLSVFPLLIVIGNALPLLHLDFMTVASYVQTAIPETIFDRILPVLQTLLNQGSGSLLSVGIIGTLWAASQGINAVKNSINRVYGVNKIQNFILKRIISLGSTLIMMVLLLSLIAVFTFGQQVLEFIAPIIKLPSHYIHLFSTLKWPVTFSVLYILLVFIYYFIPNVKMRLRSVLPGALLTTVGWLALAQAFSLYLRYFGTSWVSYGTIGAFIILLLWLNYSATVLMVGAVLNEVIEEAVHGPVDVSRGKVHDFIVRRQHR